MPCRDLMESSVETYVPHCGSFFISPLITLGSEGDGPFGRGCSLVWNGRKACARPPPPSRLWDRYRTTQIIAKNSRKRKISLTSIRLFLPKASSVPAGALLESPVTISFSLSPAGCRLGWSRRRSSIPADPWRPRHSVPWGPVADTFARIPQYPAPALPSRSWGQE